MSEALTTRLPVAGLPGHARIADVWFSPMPLPHTAAARQFSGARAYGSPCTWSPTSTVQADEATVEVAGATGPFNFMRVATKPTRQSSGSHAQMQMNACAARYRVADLTIPCVARLAAVIRRLRASHVMDPRCRMTRERAHGRQRLAVLGGYAAVAAQSALPYRESFKDC